MNVLIIEDELSNVEIARNALHKIDSKITVLGPLTSIRESVDYLINNPTPDLILCDVCLDDGDSFEIFRQIDTSAPLVFVTAYDEYAREAFRAHGLRFLSKPLNVNELQEVVNFVQQNFNKQQRQRFLAPTDDGLKAIRTEDINMLVSLSGATKIILSDKNEYLIPRPLAKIEQELDATQFVRVSRGTIVRIDKITNLLRIGNELAAVKVEGCDEPIAVSRNRILFLKQALDQ